MLIANGTTVNAKIFVVTNTNELIDAVRNSNHNNQPDTISLYSGTYELTKRLLINENFLTLQSSTHVPSDVIIKGSGMKRATEIEVLFDIKSSYVTISGITIQEAANHLIQLRAESAASHFTLTNCVLRDSFEQMLKVSGTSGENSPFSDHGRVENCLFEYTNGIGPQYYIGGIDAHRIRNWTIKNNMFRNIASPGEHIAEHAIHIWNNSKDNIVSGNIIINSDRGIGFGMGQKGNQNSGGIIENNVILHTRPDHPYADAGIIIESSPGTIIRNNIIELNTPYPNAIEYRFPETQDVKIFDNTVNKRIRARDGAQATVFNNKRVD